MNGTNNHPSPRPESTFVLGVRFDNVDTATALESVADFVKSRNGAGARSVFFTNVHTIHLARQYRPFRDLINAADLVLPDGSGLQIAGRLFRAPVRENLNGTDLTPKLLRIAEREGWSVYLLGSTRGVLAGCIARLRRMHPTLRVVGCHEGYFSGEQERQAIEEINGRRPDILLVGLGSPRQEQWIARHAAELNAGVCLGVGGLFDFLAERFRRAPHWMRRLGLEWVYRFLQDPKTKWNRIFVEIPAFLALVVFSTLLPKRIMKQASREIM